MNKQQSGFIMMVMIVIMVVGAAAYFGGVGKNIFRQNLTDEQLTTLKELQLIKAKLLEFAVQHDQLYSTTSGNNPTFYPSAQAPGPGYLPCPDNVGTEVPDGAMSNNCQDTVNTTNDGFVHGFLPDHILGRNFFFSQEFYKPFNNANRMAKRYYYVVHEQFTVNNPTFLNTVMFTNMNRFAPLNSDFTPNPLSLLSLDGSRQYIALLIVPGKAQSFPDNIVQNQANSAVQNFLDYGIEDDGLGNLIRVNANVNTDNSVDTDFFTSRPGVNDMVIGITLQEWQEAVLQRVESQKDWLCAQINPAEPVWFNAYNATTNPVGGGWRAIVCP